jgi:hypothetical protein
VTGARALQALLARNVASRGGASAHPPLSRPNLSRPSSTEPGPRSAGSAWLVIAKTEARPQAGGAGARVGVLLERERGVMASSSRHGAGHTGLRAGPQSLFRHGERLGCGAPPLAPAGPGGLRAQRVPAILDAEAHAVPLHRPQGLEPRRAGRRPSGRGPMRAAR